MRSGYGSRSRSIASRGRFGMPALCARMWRSVMRSLPWRANSGMKSQTRSSRWSTCSSSSLWITIAVIAFDAEKMLKGLAVVSGTRGPSGGSCGALPRAWPIAAVQHHAAVAAHAELERRMHARAVERDHALPHASRRARAPRRSRRGPPSRRRSPASRSSGMRQRASRGSGARPPEDRHVVACQGHPSAR